MNEGANMLRKSVSYGLLLFAVALPVWMISESVEPQAKPSSGASASIKPFVGRWDLSIKTPTRELPSWIEVSEEQGQPKVVMVGVSDHATPLAKVELKTGELEFLSPKGEEGFSEDTSFKGKLVGGRLVGNATAAGGKPWPWTGVRAPDLKRERAAPQWGKPITLFSGKDFTGWHFSDPKRKDRWTVEDGTMVANEPGPEIITNSKFEDFKLHVEFNCGPKSNSGVYLRGRYEVQIETDSQSEADNRRMGAVYGFIAPSPEPPRKPGEWQTYDITLVGQTVTVVLNGTTIIDHQDIPGITGGALDSHEASPGAIYFQGSEEGRVAFRNIVITPAK
jgi:3-keto-disaccharide hydrolase